MDLLGDSSQIFGISGEDYSWAQSFPFETLPDEILMVAPLDKKNPVPSARNADAPWDKDVQFQLTIDGFLVSRNIKVKNTYVRDLDFMYSDHNPVVLEFSFD